MNVERHKPEDIVEIFNSDFIHVSKRCLDVRYIGRLSAIYRVPNLIKWLCMFLKIMTKLAKEEIASSHHHSTA